LVPNDPIPAAMAAAVAGEGVAIYTYSVGPPGEAPQIEFSQAFLDRCRAVAT
jgi:hypothetical protein